MVLNETWQHFLPASRFGKGLEETVTVVTAGARGDAAKWRIPGELRQAEAQRWDPQAALPSALL